MPLDEALPERTRRHLCLRRHGQGRTVRRLGAQGDAVVPRIRHRPHHHDRRGRAARLCPVARHRGTARQCRTAADRALERGAGDGDNRPVGESALRAGPGARNRCAGAGARRRKDGRRFRVPRLHQGELRPFRPRRRGAPGGTGARSLPLHRSRHLPGRRDRQHCRAAPRRCGQRGARHAADHGARAPRRGRAPALVSDDKGLGGHWLAVPLQDNAMRGTWRVRAYIDPDAAPIAEQRFLVEDFVPDRVEFELAADAERMEIGEPAPFSVEGRFLYGAAASGLTLEGEVTVARVRPRRLSWLRVRSCR
jgi:hypothetical protein